MTDLLRLPRVLLWLCALLVAVCACTEPARPFLSDATTIEDNGGPTPECTLPEILCSNRCVNPANDPRHCGGCGIACGRGEVCAGGRCDTMCPESQARCNERCTLIQTDRRNCGACGNVCPGGQVCSAGRCGLVCGPMYSSCEIVSLDGGTVDADTRGSVGRYCTDPRTDELNCGACGTRCPLGNICVGGACSLSCTRGLTRCGSLCVDLQNSAPNCGACGTACQGAQRCVAGRCDGARCLSGQTLCGSTCVNLRTSGENCGACGTRCPDQSQCEASVCVPNCRRGFAVCGDQCADLQSDLRHCGACGRVCPAGQGCVAGSCQLQCPLDRVPCGTACVDLSNDPRNCGVCGESCAAGAICTGGVCAQTCAPTQTRCGGGRCANLRVDPANCGACGLACASDHACVSGMCMPLAGADAVACAAPGSLCGSTCVDVRGDNLHCGGCGRPCGPSRVCVAGMCTAPCALGQLRCGGSCVDGLSDPANCGACALRCGATESCRAGRCVAGLLPTRFTPTPMPSGASFVDACAIPGASRLLAGIDEGEARTLMPFAFRYFTTVVPEGAPIVVSTNGWIALDGLLFGGRNPSSPSVSPPNHLVAVHAGDQETEGPICVALTGAEPSRRWVVEWSGNIERNSVGPLTGTRVAYEAIFYEGTGVVEFVYGAVAGTPVSRYHGLESPTATSATSTSGCASTTSHFCIAAAGSSVRFTPSP